ncbi:hypothetical protein LDENG_00044930 [Lucifuga dentata]|nr:hypothetical protein LDENG_00044930 [Lucifuga dentata]
MKLLLAVFLLWLHVWRTETSHPKPSCPYPPSQWCRSLEITIECQVQKQCMEMKAIRSNAVVLPVQVVLYYESLCPFSRVFITEQLFPTWTMLQDIMTVTLVPYGNAKCFQLNAPNILWSSIDSCVSGDLGSKLMHINAAMTQALNPPHTHVPWLTINGEYPEENEAKAKWSLFHLVCQLYQGLKPPACSGAQVRLERNFS